MIHATDYKSINHIYMYTIGINEIIDLYEKVKDILSNSRKKKIERMIYFEDRLRSVGGELLVYYGLKKHYNILPHQISIINNNFGKPYITYKNRKIEFNISHSGEIITCVFGENCELGIDVEKVVDIDINSFRHILHEKEFYLLQSLNDNEKTQNFFKIWCLKEAYGKSLGIGINYFLKAKDFSSLIAYFKFKSCKINTHFYYIDTQCPYYIYVICCNKPFFIVTKNIKSTDLQTILNL